MAAIDHPRHAPPSRSVAWRLATEPTLVRRASAGNPEAFAEIYRRYQDPISRYCRSILADPGEAQDAFQTAMASAMSALHGETRTIQLKPWLYRIAHNECVSALRRQRPHRSLEDVSDVPGIGTEAILETRTRLRQLVTDLHTLSDRHRSALVMRELGGLDYADIARAFETTAAGAKQSVYEARVHLNEIVEGRAVDCEAIRRTLSDGDGRSRRARKLRAHLRGCDDCQSFGEVITTRRADLQILAPPLAAPAAASVLAGLLHGGTAGSGAGGTAAGAAATTSATGASMGVAGVKTAVFGFPALAKSAAAGVATLSLTGGGYEVLRANPEAAHERPPAHVAAATRPGLVPALSLSLASFPHQAATGAAPAASTRSAFEHPSGAAGGTAAGPDRQGADITPSVAPAGTATRAAADADHDEPGAGRPAGSAPVAPLHRPGTRPAEDGRDTDDDPAGSATGGDAKEQELQGGDASRPSGQAPATESAPTDDDPGTPDTPDTPDTPSASDDTPAPADAPDRGASADEPQP